MESSENVQLILSKCFKYSMILEANTLSNIAYSTQLSKNKTLLFFHQPKNNNTFAPETPLINQSKNKQPNAHTLPQPFLPQPASNCNKLVIIKSWSTPTEIGSVSFSFDTK